MSLREADFDVPDDELTEAEYEVMELHWLADDLIRFRDEHARTEWPNYMQTVQSTIALVMSVAARIERRNP